MSLWDVFMFLSRINIWYGSELNIHICRLKAYYCIDLFGPKNQSFRNKSGKTQPIRTKFGIREQIKRWQRSGNFGRDRPILAKMGAGTSPAEPEFFFFGKPRDISATSQRTIFTNLVTERISVSRRRIRKDNYENFHFRGHLSSKFEIEIRSNRHLTRSRL